jgi:hypothetical protein
MIPITEPAGRRTEAAQCPAQGCGCADTDALTAASMARLQHLFRTLTRAGLVHPLQHLMLRYRAGEGCE